MVDPFRSRRKASRTWVSSRCSIPSVRRSGSRRRRLLPQHGSRALG